MNIIYTLFIIVITLILNASVTTSIPYMKTKWKAFITRISRKKNTRTHVDCVVLEKRIASLEKRLEKRQENYRQAMRQEIKNVLLELKNK